MGSIPQDTEIPAGQQPILVPIDELASESTLPLLTYLVRSRETPDGQLSDVFRDVKAKVGKAEREIPDESEQLQTVLIDLINKGPASDGQKLKGSPKVTIVGAGVSGLCAGYELKKAGFDVTVLEASSRVGGRVKTFREPNFAPGLHGEGGAMRIPKNHFLLHKYIADFGLKDELFNFEMKNKFIYISGYGSTVTYNDFCALLKKEDPTLLSLFPGLLEGEKGKTPDDLFTEAVKPVVADFWQAYDKYKLMNSSKQQQGEVNIDAVNIDALKQAYAWITALYDKYTLRSYLTDVAHWSEDAINLYDLGNAHVVFENGFIESFKDAFLSSNDEGAKAGMQQLQPGMDAVPNGFISPDRKKDSLIDNIIFGARVVEIRRDDPPPSSTPSVPRPSPGEVTTTYVTNTGQRKSLTSDYLILAIPYTSQRTIAKSHAFEPLQEMAIRDVRYVEVTKILLQYKERWWNKIFEKQDQGLDGGLVTDLPIRYTMFPVTKGNKQFEEKEENGEVKIKSKRGVIMAAYTFEQDATNIGALSPDRRVQIAAENLDRIFPDAKSLDLLEVGASQVFPADELAGGSAFCYFGPMQKSRYLPTMIKTDWNDRVFFAGEQASFTHGWIQGAFEAGLRCVQQVWTRTMEVQAPQ